jgi:alpha-tubulin suppressor-like RCC1 family protein
MSNRWKAGFIQAFFDPLTEGPFAGGELYTVGRQNFMGALGDGTTVNKSSPIQIGTDLWLEAKAGKYSNAAIRSDGTLWAWGSNNTGNLGIGDRVYKFSPVQVGALSTWSKVNKWEYTSAAIKTDGSLWTWGANSNGQLGLTDVISRSSPVQVGALTDWSEVGVGESHCVAIKTDGSIWTWGTNSNGQLGNNGSSTVAYSSPVQVGALTNWTSIATQDKACFAINSDGELYAWGRNGTYAALGIPDYLNRSSPTQVGALTNWSKLSGGHDHMLAVKTDGTLWSWGSNAEGQLGLNDTTNRGSPVQIGTDTNWATPGVGYEHSFCIKTDATLWAVGGNTSTYGELGLNAKINKSSPTQVGSDTNWKACEGGLDHSIFLHT